MPESDSRTAREAMRKETGIVIPVYFPPAMKPECAEALLRETAEAFRHEVDDPECICLSVDGPGAAVEAAGNVARDLGLTLVGLERNSGKLGALRQGMHPLLRRSELTGFATVDQDGDHFANELLNLVRAAQHAAASAGTDNVMALGRRISRHRPMGLLRGELEELADRMLLDALHYDAAVTGRPLRMEFAATMDEFPDFHSGYKFFTRAAAERVFLPEPNLAGMDEGACSRHAVEAVLSVEALQGGALLAVVNRSTFDEQPVSTFALLNRRRMIADKILWPCRRLNVPGAFVAQWMANHLPRLLLGTLVPQGQEELAAIRRLVLKGVGLAGRADEPIRKPRFI